MNINNRKDILLLMLYSPGLADTVNEPIEGRTRLVKMLFLFRKELLSYFKKGTQLDFSTFYDFENYKYGPFSSGVYADLDFFIINGFIVPDLVEASDPQPETAEYVRYETASPQGLDEIPTERFRLSDERGVPFAHPMYESLSGEQKRLLLDFKRRMNGTSLFSILRYVYSKYPETAVNSDIADRVMRKR